MFILNLKKSMALEKKIFIREGNALKTITGTVQKKQAPVHFILLGIWQQGTGSRFQSQ